MSDDPAPRTLAALRLELRALRDEAPNVGFFRSIESDVTVAISALARLLGDGASFDLPAPLRCTPEQLLKRLRAVRNDLEQHSLVETNGRRALDLRTANFSIARAVVFLVDDIRRVQVERTPQGVGAAA